VIGELGKQGLLERHYDKSYLSIQEHQSGYFEGEPLTTDHTGVVCILDKQLFQPLKNYTLYLTHH
jgi:hypothetical protein